MWKGEQQWIASWKIEVPTLAFTSVTFKKVICPSNPWLLVCKSLSFIPCSFSIPRLAYSCSELLFLSFFLPDKPPTSSVMKSYQARITSSTGSIQFNTTVCGKERFHSTDSELFRPGNSCLKPPFRRLHLDTLR